MTDAIVGREAELDAVERFLDAVREEPAALVIEGEAGIGKTTLWQQAVDAAHARGFRVLVARPAESEAKLSYAALADLFGGPFDETCAELPEPQQHALGAALLRREAGGAADPRTTATAVVAVLHALAARGPTVVAVDDVQWLDRASERALEFAARRLPAQAGLLLTRRSNGESGAPLALDRALPERRVQTVVPTPLSLAALHHLIRNRIGAAPARPTLVRIAASSGGNPFFALELARAATREPPDRSLGEPLPMPRRLQELVAPRVRGLSGPAQDVLQIAASLSRPTVSDVVRAFGSGDDALPALAEAEDAGVLVPEGDRLRFTHPLFASSVYGSTSSARRRQLHRHLAQVVEDREERAHHLAASVTEPSEAIAGEVEEGARQAALRGAHDAAAELFAASVRLTPPDRPEEVARRLRREAIAFWRLDDLDSARSRAEQALATSPRPAPRAEALLLLARFAWAGGAISQATGHLEQALAEASGDPDLEARAHADLSFMALGPARRVEHADAAMHRVSASEDPGLLASVLINRFGAEVEAGCPARRELFDRGLALEKNATWSAPSELAQLPHPLPLIVFGCLDEFAAARARHELEDTWYRDVGDEGRRAERRAYRALVELHAGQWELADEYIEASCRALEHLDARGPTSLPFVWRSLIDAHRGRLARARATLVPLLEKTERSPAEPWSAFVLSVLGFVEFAAGDYEAADRTLLRMREQLDANGAIETLLDRSEPLHVEILVTLGEVDRARAALERLEERGQRLRRPWIAATLPRARALLLAAEGDAAGALTALGTLDVAMAAQLPFELAQALLLEGTLHRRLKQKRAATDALQRALETFERLGSPPWVERTKGELARVGLRPPSPRELTETERRVAELAAAGRTNREVAQALFMSPKTVESNLSRVYRKLGIRSRAELGARMVDHA